MKQESTLRGVRVIEICNVAAGPFCGMLLADMGADVIKIEHPEGGDTLRSWAPLTEGFSENFASLNRSKRSITLNLKNKGDVETARQLIKEADVVLENNRPGVMDRLGLGYGAMREINPGLVYCSISAYGQTGPRSQEGGFDLTLQAMSGLMSVTGEPGGAPVKCGVPVCDFTAGLYAAFSIVSALRGVEREGQGTHIDISMLGATLGIAALQTSQYFGTGINPEKLGSAHPRNAPYQVFKCRDGYFGMAAGNDSLWKSVCVVVSREDLLGDERFLTTTDRATHQNDLREILELIFARADAQTWLERFRDAGVPCAPINNYSDVLSDPQVAHMQWVQDLEMPNGVSTKTFVSPIRFDSRTADIGKSPPALGEHSAEILAELGAKVAG
ncbi:CaiB/BaiF CoA transferase family protein [Paralcaligenes ureilyticus]|uniref:Crotonobetainyl-CoA:carnitine CoA-transferase CaiB-like acyl-CoA transferase n=1 Tax=Paralcaligenes ureilyticus TaxID=627131 RepID=A0A4R3LPD4_9BURK|nr:CoA transferase [Paralcaligenes ureilyticus]TCT02304.1 crotonobetainyl-CoA:carnitine CoA-transferase CaiB-like acyl-CoA transferase [Paralcaligenes ureilyticus]